MNIRNILALEGEWDDSIKDTKSVAPALQFLQQVRLIDFVHRRVPTKEAFLHYLNWGVEERFRIFYLAGHGSPNSLQVGDEITGQVTLDEITSALDGRLGYNNVVVHLGGCELLQASKKSLRSMKAATKARLISGYTKQVDFLDSMLLEMAWFSFLQQKGAFDAFHDFLGGPHRKLIQELGFEVI